MIEFHLPVAPPKATSQTKRLVMIGGKPRFFHNKKHQAAEGDLMGLMLPHAPARPLEGPVRLCVEFVFQWRASEPKKRRALGRVPMTSRPDCDNLVKLVGDVLTKLLFYKDDSQVVDLQVRKYWGDEVGISIKIEEVLA